MSHVPGSVYVLFAVLAWMGLVRCFPRTIRIERLMLMPAIMTVLGVRSFFGLFPTVQIGSAIAAFVGLLLGLTVGTWHIRRWTIRVDRESRSITLPGDALMLVIIMASFAFEFILHFGVASGATWASTGIAATIAANVWGFFIGMSLGRNLGLVRRYFDMRPMTPAA